MYNLTDDEIRRLAEKRQQHQQQPRERITQAMPASPQPARPTNRLKDGLQEATPR